jgi:hypothetical protein
MNKIGSIRVLFVLAGFYDGLLGLAFLAAGPALYGRFGVTPPNHWGYVQFPALLLIVFAIMFFAIAARPHARRELILYGIMLKISYCGVTLYHWLAGGLPGMWKPFTVADLTFLILFVWAFAALARADRARA